MADIIKSRRDTAENWTSANPILSDGELGFETDTKRFKLGDGKKAWNNLDYFDRDVDDEPTAGSENLVKSGGVKQAVDEVKTNLFTNVGLVRKNGGIIVSSDWLHTPYLPIPTLPIKIKSQGFNSESIYATCVFFDEDKKVLGYIDSVEDGLLEYELNNENVPQNTTYFRTNVRKVDVSKTYIENAVVGLFERVSNMSEKVVVLPPENNNGDTIPTTKLFTISGLVRSNGEFAQAASFLRTDYLLLPTNLPIRVKSYGWTASTIYATCAFYDEDKKFISAITSDTPGILEYELNSNNVPKTARYFVINSNPANAESCYVENYFAESIRQNDSRICDITQELDKFDTIYSEPEIIQNVEYENGYYKVPTGIIAKSDAYMVSKPIPLSKGEILLVETTIVSHENNTGSSCHIIFDGDGNPQRVLESQYDDITVFRNLEDKDTIYVGFTFRSDDDKTIKKRRLYTSTSQNIVEEKPSEDEKPSEETTQTTMSLYDRIPRINDFAGLASEKIRNKILTMEDDINIVIDGDSLTAITNLGEELPNAANLPPGCQRNTLTYMLWNMLCKNKQQCDRFDSKIHAFEENGTFNVSDVTKQNNSGISGAEKGEYNSDNSLYRETSVTNDYIQFNWNLNEYEKLNFIHRLGLDGTTEVRIECPSDKIKVFDRNTSDWVEANGYTFSQKTAASAKGSGKSDWVRNVALKFKVNEGVNKSEITIKVINSGTGTMYYWGTERWNFNTLRVTNIARAGRHIELLSGVLDDEVKYRDIDYFFIQLPIWNEMKQGGNYNEVWDKRHKAFLDKLKTLSDNFSKFQASVVLCHTQVYSWKGNTNLKFKANGKADNPETAELEYPSIMRTYQSLLDYNENVSVLPVYRLIYEYANSINMTMEEFLSAKIDGFVDESVVEGDTTLYTFTTDGCHFSNAGFRFYCNCIYPIFSM